MDSWKVLIADPSEDFRDALAGALDPRFRVLHCGRGDEALGLILRERPDLLILELSLPGLDGIGLLRQLDEPPRTLVVTNLNTLFVQAALVELRIQYALLKTCSMTTIAQRALELMEMDRTTALSRQACTMLESLGLPCGRQGFQHLLTGLPLLTADRDQRLGKELYRQIARQSNASVTGVEKAIRDTIQAGWENGDPQVWQRFFPGCTRCPKNKEFLFHIADLLRRSA